MENKQEAYNQLCTDVQKYYSDPAIQNKTNLGWSLRTVGNETKGCECNEINLWTYWQGIGCLSPKILVVAQDWGNPLTKAFSKTVARIKTINESLKQNEDISELLYINKPHPTDKNLIELFSHIGCKGIDITKRQKDLFFTNIVPGYLMSSKNSSQYNNSWIKDQRVKDFFYRLVTRLSHMES